MSGYVRATKLDEEFEGEKVTGQLSPLSLPDLLLLKGAQVETDEHAAKELAAIVPKYVKDFAGLTAADGSAVTIEEACATAYFLDLVLSISKKLVKSATPPSKPSETSAS